MPVETMNDTKSHAIRFVFVEPRYGGNVGAAARVLKNFGFDRLDIVAPREGTDHEEAVRMAVDAADVLAAARTHATLDEALHGAATVVGASRRMGKHRQPHHRLDALAPLLPGLASRGAVALVFGREDHGLSDADLDRCTHLVYVPTAGAYPALNVAQAIAIVAYEVRCALDAATPSAPNPEDEALVDHASREAMYAHLEEALLSIGFLKLGQLTGMMRRLRRILSRAELSSGDVDVVRGISRQILWLAKQARLDLSKKP
jgi:tRNA/rRNA methyltransferase